MKYYYRVESIKGHRKRASTCRFVLDPSTRLPSMKVAGLITRKLLRVLSSSNRHFSSVKSIMPSALVVLSEGAEEMETVITVDVLRRGEVNILIWNH